MYTAVKLSIDIHVILRDNRMRLARATQCVINRFRVRILYACGEQPTQQRGQNILPNLNSHNLDNVMILKLRL